MHKIDQVRVFSRTATNYNSQFRLLANGLLAMSDMIGAKPGVIRKRDIASDKRLAKNLRKINRR